MSTRHYCLDLGDERDWLLAERLRQWAADHVGESWLHTALDGEHMDMDGDVDMDGEHGGRRPLAARAPQARLPHQGLLELDYVVLRPRGGDGPIICTSTAASLGVVVGDPPPRRVTISGSSEGILDELAGGVAISEAISEAADAGDTSPPPRLDLEREEDQQLVAHLLELGVDLDLELGLNLGLNLGVDEAADAATAPAAAAGGKGGKGEGGKGGEDVSFGGGEAVEAAPPMRGGEHMHMHMGMGMAAVADRAAVDCAVAAEPTPGVMGPEHAVSWEQGAHDPAPPPHAMEAGLPPPLTVMASSSGSMGASMNRDPSAKGLSAKGLSASAKVLSAKAHVQQVFPYMVHVSTKAHLSASTGDYMGASTSRPATVVAARAAAVLGRKRTTIGQSTPSPATGGPEGGGGGAATAGTVAAGTVDGQVVTMAGSTSPLAQRWGGDASPHPSGRRPADGRRGSVGGAGGAGCTPAIVSARSAIYPNGVRDPSSTSMGMGTSTSRVSPLPVSRGSPVLAVMVGSSRELAQLTGAALRKSSPSLDNALNSLEAELRPSSRPPPVTRIPSYMQDRSRRLSSSPTEPQLPVSPQPAALAKQPSVQPLRRSPSLSPPRGGGGDRGGDRADRGGDWGEISLRADRGPPSLEVRAARAAAAAAKLTTGGKGGNISAAEREAEGEPAAPEGPPDLYDLGLCASMLGWKGPGSQQPVRPPPPPSRGPPRACSGPPPGPERSALAACLPKRRLRRRSSACPKSPMPAASPIAFARLCPRRFAGGQHEQIVQQVRCSPALKR